MNKFELICYYCGHSWEINYTPSNTVYCSVCKDSNIRVKNIAVERVDYYAGCQPFEEKKVELEKKQKEDDDPDKWYI